MFLCSVKKLKEHISILQWLPEYKKAWLRNDIFAGLTLGVVLIPQGIAYAIIAGLPPVYGLYTALVPQLVYAVLGTSRQLAVGPAAMDSLIVAAGVSSIAAVGSEHFIAVTIALAFLVGFFQFLFGLFQLGFLVNFLSKPVISGFTSGSAIIIALNQLGNLMGIKLDRSNQVHLLLIELYGKLGEIHWGSLLVGGLSVVALLVLKFWNKKIPAALVVILIGILTVFAFGLDDRGIDILGEIPRGLPAIVLPQLDAGLVREIVGLALTLAISLFLSIIVASMSGAGLPMLFEKFGWDPALMSGPFLTTVVDVLGLLIYFGVAALLLT